MFQLSVREHFDAAHYLKEYQGKCENLHGHRFEVVAALEVPQLNTIGLGYDFTELKRHLRDIIAPFDHVCLNDIEPFKSSTPSSENIALAIYDGLKARIPSSQAKIAYVEVWESPTSCARFIP
ncbi:MAG: 6-carboxytetrahydropterin synthase QueD [Chloroflexi bacterium]|nr:6-carboxytetrahydropterin synthase QueD [Chloroflexota bacterium]